MHTVTFYSYKGGVGRSLLVANCSLYLAQLGFRVVALDFDLEAPGLHYKFLTSMPNGFAPCRGVVDLIDDYATRKILYESLDGTWFEVPLGDSVLEPNSLGPRGWLRIIPAGSAPSFDYWRKVANIDWKTFLYGQGATGVEFFADLHERIAEELKPDLLLIDSRTGITEIGNVATSLLADTVVCIVADTLENLEGSREVLRGLRRHRRLSDESILEMKVAVSRPHPSLPLSERLEKLQAFLEEPAQMLESTLKIGIPYPLSYDPDVEQKESLVLGGDYGRVAQLGLDYMALADELVPESMWAEPRPAWSPAINSPYPYSVWNYRLLALEQPTAPVDGLYRVGRRCYIVVPGFNSKMLAADGETTLSEWFQRQKTLGTVIEIVDRIPEGSIQIPDSSLEDIVALRDAPRSIGAIDVELCLRLPRNFPKFICNQSENWGFVMEVERPLRAEERTALRVELASLQYGLPPRPVILVNPAIANDDSDFRALHGKGSVDLIPSRRLPSVFSSIVRDMVARDEDVWISSRLKIQRGEISDTSSILPPWRKESEARLLIGSSAFTIHGARKLLPFCDRLILTLPSKENLDKDLTNMGLTQKELVTLASQGRIVVLLPQSIDRYDPTLLNDLVSQAAEFIVFSRALCAAVMIELRSRLYPWFFPGFDMRERRERLRRAVAIEPEPGSDRFFLQPLVFSRFLAHVWAREEMHTHLKGAIGSGYMGGGFGTFLSEQIDYQLKRDLFIESSEAGAAVEKAAALGATVVPMHRQEFSLLGLTKIGAALLSSLSDASARSIPPITLELPDDNRSAMDLALLNSEELRKIRTLIAAMTSGAANAELDITTAAQLCAQLIRDGILAKEGDKFTLAASSGEPVAEPEKLTGVSGPVLSMWFRDFVAGAESHSNPGTFRAPPSLPSIVVGQLGSPTP